MIKVFTSVYLLESTTNAFDAMEQVLMQKPFPAEAGDRQAVELHVELKAPRLRNLNELKSKNAGGR